MNNIDEYLCVFEPSDCDKYLYDLSEEYHRRTEEYDLYVCTGPMGRDGILPANNYQYCLINKNAIKILRELKERAWNEMGIDGKAVQRAISRH